MNLKICNKLESMQKSNTKKPLLCVIIIAADFGVLMYFMPEKQMLSIRRWWVGLTAA